MRRRVKTPEPVRPGLDGMPAELAAGCVVEVWADPVKLRAYFDDPTYDGYWAAYVSARRRYRDARNVWHQAHPDGAMPPQQGRPRWGEDHPPEPPRHETARKRVPR